MPWFRLLRLPNLLTVPGDPLAGFLLASLGGSLPARPAVLFCAAGASLALYAFGLVLNDLMDIEVDRVERPERPLPSGVISVGQARIAALTLALAGLNLAQYVGVAALVVAGMLAALIVLYNAWLKRIAVIGVVAMGLCRGLSLLLGGVAAVESCSDLLHGGAVPLWIAFGGVTLYVVAFSVVARDEMASEKPMGFARWLPLVVVGVTLPIVFGAVSYRHKPEGVVPLVFVFLMVITLLRSWLLGGMLYKLQPVPATIGGHIRNLLMFQGALCVASGAQGVLPALLLVAASFVFARLGRWFYSS